MEGGNIQTFRGENTITDIKKFLETDAREFEPSEFAEFWTSLTPEEKHEFRTTPLPKT